MYALQCKQRKWWKPCLSSVNIVNSASSVSSLCCGATSKCLDIVSYLADGAELILTSCNQWTKDHTLLYIFKQFLPSTLGRKIQLKRKVWLGFLVRGLDKVKVKMWTIQRHIEGILNIYDNFTCPYFRVLLFYLRESIFMPALGVVLSLVGFHSSFSLQPEHNNAWNILL